MITCMYRRMRYCTHCFIQRNMSPLQTISVLEKLFPALVEHLEQGDSRTGGADKSCYAESLLIMNSDHEPESCDRSVDRSPNWHSSHLRTASNRSCMVDERECDLRTHSRTAVGSFYTLNSEHSNSGG